MTDFPSSAIEIICGALNRLVSDVIINWHAQRARRQMSLIPSALSNVLLVPNGMSFDSWHCGISRNDAMEPEEITNIEIYRLKFILKRHVLVLHVTSVNIGSVQVTHRAVGARTMHGFGTDLVRNPAIWLVESRVYVNYRQVSNIRRTKSQHLNDYRTVLRLPLPNPLKPDVKSRTKM